MNAKLLNHHQKTLETGADSFFGTFEKKIVAI
jgi:hypothetical protein